jgi:Flp pilus assembly pilin Flp
MSSIKTLLAGLRWDRRGVTALEYGVIAAGTVLAITTIMPTIKTSLSTVFSAINSAL